MRCGSIGGLEYEVPQSRLYCLCINVVLCSTALQCICRVIRRSSMIMKAHAYYIIFGRPPIGGSFPLPPWRRHCVTALPPRRHAAAASTTRETALASDHADTLSDPRSSFLLTTCDQHRCSSCEVVIFNHTYDDHRHSS